IRKRVRRQPVPEPQSISRASRFVKPPEGRSVVVRAGHIVAAYVADELATPRFQPPRADRTKSRSVFTQRRYGDVRGGGLFRRDGAAGFAGCSSAGFAAGPAAGLAAKVESAGKLATWFHGAPFIAQPRRWG